MDSTAFFEAIGRGEREALVAALAEHPTLVSASAPGGATAIRWALYHRQPELARWLATQLAPDLHDAAALGDEATLAVLLTSKADVHAWCPEGFQPLHLAAFFARGGALARLLAAGAEVNSPARHPAGMCPLHSAAASREAAVVATLLAAGADPDVQQQGGYTALMSAATHNLTAMVDALLAADARTDILASDGRSAADMARDAGHTALADRLSVKPSV